MKKAIVLCGLLVACSTQQQVKTTKTLTMSPSFYQIAVETSEDSGEPVTVLSVEGKPIAVVRSTFFKRLCLEGTGRTLQGTLLNFQERLYGSYRFKEVPYPIGARQNRLTAFKSLAVDPTVIPLGSKIYIPATKGIKLPNGTTHDGYWSADDTGSAIKGARLDLFVGENSWALLEKQGIEHGKPLDVEILKQ